MRPLSLARVSAVASAHCHLLTQMSVLLQNMPHAPAAKELRAVLIVAKLEIKSLQECSAAEPNSPMTQRKLGPSAAGLCMREKLDLIMLALPHEQHTAAGQEWSSDNLQIDAHPRQGATGAQGSVYGGKLTVAGSLPFPVCVTQSPVRPSVI